MLCMKCGAPLTEQEFCANCGADVKVLLRLVRISNMYYNNGLAKANVRDLSGAIQDLKYSLEIDKYNIPARNLLGLVYFELGEVVDALTQWIISKSLKPKKNVAGEYIRAIQANSARLDTINQTIKKYNQSLLYCQQGSEDLAIIQLKKVLSMNPNLVKAHRLLALLYIKSGNYERARRELKRVLDIDRNDTIALNYQLDLDRMNEKAPEKEKKEEENQDVISYTSGNETIIMPAKYKESSGANVILNIVIGLVVGVALMWFLVIPAKIKATRAEANQQVVEYSDQLSAKQATVDSLTKELEAAKALIEELQTVPEEESEVPVEGEEGEISVEEEPQKTEADKLAEAKAAFDAGDKETAANGLAAIDIDYKIHPNTYATLYANGSASYEAGQHQTAIQQLKPVALADPSYQDGYALYYLARACHKFGNTADAIKYYTQFKDMLPDTERAAFSREAIQRLQGA